MENKQPIEIKIKTQPIELEKLDFSQYIGKESFIVDVTTMKGEYKGKESYYAKIICAPVGDFKNKDGKKQDVIPSRLFGIQQDKEGNFGWGSDTKLGLFLASKKVNTLEALKGKKVICQLDDKGYLTFT